jgi:tetratricopeptide (TPR) repeat protein
LQSQVAGAIATEIDATLSTPDQARISRARRIDLGAYDAYLKGRRQYLTEFNQESIEKALAWFQQALDLDPGYAPAYAGLADCYYMVSNMYYPPKEMMPKAKRAALKALELDDTLGEAHATLALVRSVYDFNRAEAEKEFKRALDLKPSDSQAHLWYSIHLSGMGRFDEALAEVEQARRLDPHSPAINAYILNPLLWAHRADEIIQKMTPLAEMYPNQNQPHYGLAMAYEQKREWMKAILEMERAVALEMTQDGLAQPGHMYAVSGRTADARQVLRQLMKMSRTRYVSPYNIGVLHAGLGERDEAFRWLQKVEEDRSDWFACVNVDPRLDGLHSDPRWAGILRSVGLAQ